MKVLVIFLSLFIFLKTLYYGIYEYKNNNKIPGLIIMFVSFICLVLPIIMVHLRIDLSI